MAVPLAQHHELGPLQGHQKTLETHICPLDPNTSILNKKWNSTGHEFNEHNVLPLGNDKNAARADKISKFDTSITPSDNSFAVVSKPSSTDISFTSCYDNIRSGSYANLNHQQDKSFTNTVSNTMAEDMMGYRIPWDYKQQHGPNENGSQMIKESSVNRSTTQTFETPENLMHVQNNNIPRVHDLCSTETFNDYNESIKNSEYDSSKMIPYNPGRRPCQLNENYFHSMVDSKSRHLTTNVNSSDRTVIYDDDINNMLQGYFNECQSNSANNDMEENKHLLHSSGSIIIPSIPEKSNNCDVVLQTRPLSAISSSSVVSPVSSNETINDYEVTFDANQSPSQFSNDSGFSGDYSRPLSILVQPPNTTSDVLGKVSYYENRRCGMKDNVPSNSFGSSRLLQPVDESTHSSSLNMQYNQFNKPQEVHNTDRGATSMEQAKYGFNTNPRMNTGYSFYNDRENYKTSSSSYIYNETLPFQEPNLEETSFDAHENVNRAQSVVEPNGYNFKSSNNLPNSNIFPLPHGEDLSHIVDQVLNSIDAQFSPPVNPMPRLKTISNKKPQSDDASIPTTESPASIEQHFSDEAESNINVIVQGCNKNPSTSLGSTDCSSNVSNTNRRFSASSYCTKNKTTNDNLSDELQNTIRSYQFFDSMSFSSIKGNVVDERVSQLKGCESLKASLDLKYQNNDNTASLATGNQRSKFKW